MPDITVFFLQASRCIRTVWLLEELNTPYEIDFADRVNQRAPQDFKDRSGNPLGKFPTIRDGDLVVTESGAITEYVRLKKTKLLQVFCWLLGRRGRHDLEDVCRTC